MRLHTHKVLFTDIQDAKCAALALMGMSTRCIARETGLTEGQVQFRISKAGIKRWAFRHGDSPEFKMVIQKALPAMNERVARNIAPMFASFAPK